MLPVDGLLTVARKVLYTVPPGKSATIQLVAIVNQDPTAHRRFTLYAKVGGTPRPISAMKTVLKIGSKAEEDIPFQLAAGDTIEAEADRDSLLSFCVFGEEI